jgi:hypothetical protein
MDTPKKLIVGYDLCDDNSQITCYSYKTFEPIPICAGKDEENHPIPTVLCIKNDTKQWFFGTEAISLASRGEGLLIDHLLTKIRNKEEVEIFQTKFNGVALLERFLRKSLTLIKNYFPTEPITKLVVTIRDMDPVLVEGIYEALALLGIERDRAVIMSHAGVYLYYTLNQERNLWLNDVGLFDFSEAGLRYYQLSINRRTRPMIAGLTKSDFTDTLNLTMLNKPGINAGYIFENIANEVVHKQVISTIYFTGKGFEDGWAENVMKSLCIGRRVFLGQNLYTVGACYAAKELAGDQKLSDYLLLNDDMITSSVWLKVYSDARIKEVMLTDAGVPWYEVNQSIEVIPEEENELEIVLRNMITKEINRQKIELPQLPERPERMTRLEVKLNCIDRNTLKITITDLGFGEIYPETGQILETLIDT